MSDTTNMVIFLNEGKEWEFDMLPEYELIEFIKKIEAWQNSHPLGMVDLIVPAIMLEVDPTTATSPQVVVMMALSKEDFDKKFGHKVNPILPYVDRIWLQPRLRYGFSHQYVIDDIEKWQPAKTSMTRSFYG